MHQVSDYARHRGVATLAMLHAGIEPAILALLANNGASTPDQFGWIVGAGQAGLAIGASLCWRIDFLAGRRAAQGAAAIGIVASLLLALSHDLASAIALRLVLGLAMGLLLTRATAQAARDRPHHAIGTVLLAQQALSSAVMAALPLAGAAWGAPIALAALAAAPLAIFGLIGPEGRPAPLSPSLPTAPPAVRATIRPGARRAMALICAVIMLGWTHLELVGETIGIDPGTIGLDIAIASLGSIPAALVASLRPPRLAPSLTLLVSGLCLLAPMLVPAAGGRWAFFAAMVLFNGGFAFAMTRSAAWAMEGRNDAERRGVLTIQCVAMSAGPMIGAMALSAGGIGALTLAAAAGTAGAALSLMFDLPGRIAGILRETRAAAQLESDRLWRPNVVFQAQG